MTGVGDTPRDFTEFIRDTRKRTTSLERSNSRASSLGGYLNVGAGLTVDGLGTLEEPYTISLGTMSTVDWDDAMDVGYYYAETGSLNAPLTAAFVGEVYVHPILEAVIQEVIVPSFGDIGKGRWRRQFDGTNWSSWRQTIPLSGTATVPGTGTYFGNLAISLPAGYFLTPPAVLVGSVANGSTTTGVLLGTAVNVTTTGFTARVQTAQGTNFGTGQSVYWTATEI